MGDSDLFDRVFECLQPHRVLLCRACAYAVVPKQVDAHLSKSHRTLSKRDRRNLAAQVAAREYLATEPTQVVYPKPKDGPVQGLPVWRDGFRCDSVEEHGVSCDFVCRTIYRIQQHCKVQHGWVNAQRRGGDKRAQHLHSPNKLWETDVACQQFFRVPGWKRYFQVDAGSSSEGVPRQPARGSVEDKRRQFFQTQEQRVEEAQRDAADRARRVQGFADHRSTVVPWLRETGIADHIRGLSKDEIRTAIALPEQGREPILHDIIRELDSLLHEAHGWCFDGPDCLLTWPCRVVLSRFQSSLVETTGKTRAFDPYKESASLKAYFTLAKRCLAYFARVAAGEDYHFTRDDGGDVATPEDVIEVTEQQLKAWHDVCKSTRRKQATAGVDDAQLRDGLIELWMLLVCHETGARRYRSPLVSFCAMLSIKPSTLGWMQPGDFNSNLSKIIWVVQLLLFYDSARKERQGQGETLQLVKQRCESYLQQTVEAPMGEILRWRLLLFHVSKNSVGHRHAEWDETEQVLTFEDTELHMHQIPTLLVTEYRECERLLRHDLLLGSTEIHRMHSWALKDNASVDVVDWNFTQHRDNVPVLCGSDRALLRAIATSPTLCRLFLTDDDQASTGLTWRDAAVASYEGSVQEFLKRLCTLVHISGGQPLRENEFFSMTWRNTQRQRSITIRHEKVMVHTTYHKGQQQTGAYKDNIRFLAHPVGDLLLDYIVYVLPLRQVFHRQSSPKALTSPFLWESGGHVWPAGHLSRSLQESSARARIPRLHVSNWRQMSVAIVKTKFATQIACFEADNEDEDAEEMESDIRAMTKQRNHKTRTVNRAYANHISANFGNVWDGLVRTGLRASTLWQDFWGVDTILCRKRHYQTDSGPRLVKRLATGLYRPRKPWSADALLGGIQRLYGAEDVAWKSTEQERALSAVMSWTEQVVAILPTGAGKSMLFMLPCTLPDAEITVLVVPLVSLRGDLIRRLRDLQIDHIEWQPGERRESGLVLVSVEAAATKDFMGWARTLVARQKLDRIVIDECHLTVTAAAYRQSIEDLAAIRSLRTQFVYLTATLPPSMQREFEERNHLIRPTVIRASSNRPNIFYMVRKAIGGAGSLLEQAATEAQDAWTRSGLFEEGRDKIILYVRTRREAEELAGLLRCNAYTARSGSAMEKSEIVRGWTQSAGQPFMVATSAFAEGFDYPHIRMVINVNEPDSIVLFAQESGRAGRDGERAYSLVLLPSTWKTSYIGDVDSENLFPATRDISLGKQRERGAMHKYLTGRQCFRTSLSEHLDMPEQRRWCMGADVPCDVCKEPHDGPIGQYEDTVQSDISNAPFTGADLIQLHRQKEYFELAKYLEDLASVRGICLLCRTVGVNWDHEFAACSRRHSVFHERKRACHRHEARGKRWLRPYTACFWCLNPQSVCERANPDSDHHASSCEQRDVVLPLCYGIFHNAGGATWLHENFGRVFDDVERFFDWLGEESCFGGGKAIQAVRVAAKALENLRL